MCCSGNFALISHTDLALRRRWHALQASMAAAESEAAENYVHAPGVAVREGGGGAAVKQYCMCSPTRHPGSFRCRQHHAEYAWGTGRVVRRTARVE